MKVRRAALARALPVLLAFFLLSVPPLGAHAQRVARSKALSGPAPKYKAIWEPINYPADIQLNYVYFATEKRGWIAGTGNGSQGGVLLATTDAGAHWQVQLGDPGSADPAYEHLYFLDAKHGWAVQDARKILRTSDGSNWEEVGSFPQFHPFQGYKFTSQQTGYEIAGYPGSGSIFSTQDGGRSWKEDFKCVTQLQVQGLTKRLGCSFTDLSFPSPQVGYAVGGGYNGGFAVIAKTEDAGASWRMIFASTNVETVRSVFFTDEKHGVVRLGDNKIFATEDGGQTWRGMPAQARGPLRFADPQVAWSCDQRTCAITTDGGEHWTSHDVRLPEYIRDFSVARRDRVFLVGSHGMIYRYRVVPSDYRAKLIAAAPLVPGYGTELTTQLSGMEAKVEALQEKVASAKDDSFVQDTSFTQDVSTIDSASQSFEQSAPVFAGHYRNLNLLFVGLNMLNELQGRAAGIHDATQALKDAKDLNGANAALQDLLAKLQDAHTTIASGFENVAESDAPTTAGGPVGNMLAAPDSGSAANSASQPASENSNNSGNSNGSAANTAANVGHAVDTAKSVLKHFIKF